MNAIGPASPDERELMRSLQEGSTSALGVLCERTAPVLWPLALRITGSRERAAAVLEDFFEEVWRDRARWRGSAEIPAVPWIARCRELALAQAGPEPGRPAADPPSAVTRAPRVPGPEQAVAGARETAREAFQALREPDRRALEEAYFRGVSAREVAVLIGTPTSEAGATLRSALVRFREHVAEREAVGSEAGGAS